MSPVLHIRMLNFSFLLSTYLQQKVILSRPKTLRFSSEGMWPIKTCLGFYGVKVYWATSVQLPGTTWHRNLRPRLSTAPALQAKYDAEFYTGFTAVSFFLSAQNAVGEYREPNALTYISDWKKTLTMHIAGVSI